MKLSEKFPIYRFALSRPKMYYCNTQQLIGAVFALSLLTPDGRKDPDEQEFFKWCQELRVIQGSLWMFDTVSYETMLELYKRVLDQEYIGDEPIDEQVG